MNALLKSLCLAALAWAALAAPVASATETDADFLKRLHERFPATVGEKVTPAFPGFWAVVDGGDIVFVRDDLSVLIRGDVVDLKTNHSLLASLREENRPRIDLAQLDVKDAISLGHGAHRLYVFSDPDCPYCRKLQPELSKLKDVEVLVFPYPLDTLHPNAPSIAQSIWCQKDRATAWTAYLTGGHAPATATCDNPIARDVALGQKLQLMGTPSLVFEDGSVIPGAVDAERIQERVASAARK